MKKLLRLVMVFLGLIAVFLGTLWFLQGAGILEMCPVLCFADCECIRGGSLFWEIIGPIVIFFGIAIIYKSFVRKKQS